MTIRWSGFCQALARFVRVVGASLVLVAKLRDTVNIAMLLIHSEYYGFWTMVAYFEFLEQQPSCS